MKLSNLISKLQKLKKSEGDLTIVIPKEHEYWGTLYAKAIKVYIINASYNSPSNIPEKCIIISDI